MSLMTDDWKTLRVPADKYKEAKAQKEEHNRTWGQQIVRDSDKDTTTDGEVVEDILHKLDQIQSAQSNTVNDALEIAEQPALDDAVTEIKGRIDDLENNLPRKVREELR